jgi:hypothetical protein
MMARLTNMLLVAAIAIMATPAAAKNAKLGKEVLGEWCAIEDAEGNLFFPKKSTIWVGTDNINKCSNGAISIRRDGIALEEDGYCEALKTEIIDYVVGATRGQGPDGKPLLSFRDVATPVYRVKYRCSGEGAIWTSVQIFAVVKGYLEVREIKHGRERPLK